MNKEQIKEILTTFNIKEKIANVEALNHGHINTTLLITTTNMKIVLQKINHFVFKNPYNVMENISNVTKFIKNEINKTGKSSNRRVLKFLACQDGKYCYKDETGNYWRVYKYVKNSITFNSTSDLNIIQETGKAFGEFQQYLNSFPIKDLHIIIPHFHNTINRYEIFENAVNNDKFNRVASSLLEIKEYRNLKTIATKMYKMQKNGELKLRVTHNDTKCNNVLFDSNTLEHLCVIDLDTVMPGLVGFDFGDAIRFVANTAAEDETDLNKVNFDLNKFEAFTKGFLSAAGKSLTKTELETLPLGAITMTIECGLRFLTDYLEGDCYFKTAYPSHNHVRAKCQLKLAQDMIQNHTKMQEIVNKYINNISIEN